MQNRRFQIAALSCLGLVLAAGCQSGKSDGWKFTSALPAMPWSEDGPESEMPARMVTSWTHTVLHRSGEKPQRGFGGRLMFFRRGSDQPVRVDGQLVVYAYDETDRPEHETHPTRRYIFPAEQFARLESENKLGPAYSVWLPWDEVGGSQKQISLIARFEPTGGPLVLGEQTKHLLPGSTLTPPLETSPEVQLASHAESTETPSLNTQENAKPQAEDASERKIGVRTTAIPLPRRK